eukprot:TRINITY_DN50433_c0_g1_i1.p1 TRINITY_DN50433_c0_g1~~TRINITY_DN50433_c0_g1_i1.p1  ORF type:complete len:497 (-),score=28.68 TRINITY_DN50433_c0_g1_i1:129-1565(-)
MDEFLENLANSVGLPVGILQIVICQIASIPFGAVCRYLPPAMRWWYNLVLGLLFTLFLYRTDMVYLLIGAFTCYGAIRVLPPHIRVPVVWVIAFGQLLYSHFWRLFGDDNNWRPEVVNTQLVNTLQLIALAYNSVDMNADPKTLHQEELNDRLEKIPTLLEVLSWLFFFPCVVGGPVIMFNRYKAFVENPKLPSCSEVLPLQLMQAIPLAILSSFEDKVPFNVVLSRDIPWYHQSLWYKMAYLEAACVVVRCKYYFVFSLAHCSLLSSGCAFSRKAEPALTYKQQFRKFGLWHVCRHFLNSDADSKGNQWGDLVNMRPVLWELCPNVATALKDAWNINVARWMRVYVYQRAKRPDQGRPTTQRMLLTQLVGAVWHGFFPGYYVFYAGVALCVFAGRSARRTLRPLFLGTWLKPLYDAAGTVSVWIGITIPGVCFALRHWSDCWACSTNLGHFSWFATLALLGFCAVVKRVLPRPKKAA